jgi:hypothetical protein
MRAVSDELPAAGTKYGGQFRPTPDTNRNRRTNLSLTDKSVRPTSVTRINGRRITFRELARFAWPSKTEFFLSDLTRCDARTCRRWLAGSNDPPAKALGVILQEILRLYHLR